MSYNIRYDNPNDGEHAWRHRRDWVATTIDFHRPDVVGLQEAFQGQLHDISGRLGAFEWLPAGRRHNAERHPGENLAIGYRRVRFNREGYGTFWLSERPEEPGVRGWDASLPRLAQYARLRERNTDVEFVHFNTHFDHRGETARERSAALLLDRIDEVAPDVPVIVTGDLNCRESTAPYRYLTRREKASAGRTLLDAHYAGTDPHHGPTTSMTDFNNLVPEKKIDYVLVSGDVEVHRHGTCSDTYENGRYPSDHLPVIADLSLPELAARPRSPRDD